MNKAKNKLTAHQFDIVSIVVKGNEGATPEEKAVDLDQILERVTKKTSKESMQFSIRALTESEIITKLPRVKRRGRMRVIFSATDFGRSLTESNAPGPSFIEPEPGSVEEMVENFDLPDDF